jgi:hypothetical protein
MRYIKSYSMSSIIQAISDFVFVSKFEVRLSSNLLTYSSLILSQKANNSRGTAWPELDFKWLEAYRP